ncbi:MAG TPA: pitrilysin family protein [Planctomycetota bacterium]|nr:pitrilysin family protein [Planctomycetota bacterium]
MRKLRLAGVAAGIVALGAAVRAQDKEANFDGLASKVNEILLDNGLRVLVLERHNAPTVAFATAVNVGSVDERTGETGLAHMFEHMAFKGSTTVGTKDWPKEKAALEVVEERFAAYHKLVLAKASKAAIQDAKKAFEQAQEEAGKYVEPEEYSKIIERNGGEGLNAFTAADMTVYHVEMPANRLELWFLLESDRFRDNVLREFYKERGVVMEERRMRTESSPEGKMFEDFIACAFMAHPYGRPTIGWMSDLEALSATTARKFFDRFYTPDNMTISIVGDVQTSEVKRLAQKYFGPMERGPKREPVPTIEPKQEGEKRIEVEIKAQPVVALAWHGPAARDEDSDSVDALTDVMANGRTSRLYKRLVVEEKLAVNVSMGWGEPGQKYPNLIYAFAIPAPGKKNDDCVKAIDEEIEKVKKEPCTDDELAIVKTRDRANFVRGLRGNLGIAESLATHQVQYGDWKSLFSQPKHIATLTPEDLRKVARKYLTRSNRSRADIVAPYDKKSEKQEKE